jgi:two-component system OmpR family response regulator
LPEHKILVVDDERRIVDIVKAYLERDGYRVIAAYDGRAALDAVKAEKPDLIVLDLMLPEVNGWDVCRRVRKESETPVIMLTARDDTTDKIVGLELGADDYVTKPFDPKELVSRVRAVLRRYEGRKGAAGNIIVSGLDIDVDRRIVRRDNEIIELTSTEFDLLRALAESPGRVFTRMQLLDITQGEAYEGYERTIDSHIKNLRKKVEPNPERPRYIITVHGTGYKLEVHPRA